MKSIWARYFDELALINAGFCETAEYVKDLIKENDRLTALTQSKKPICPYCKTEMSATNFSHYYSEGAMPVWFCNCEDFPEKANAKDCYQGH